MIDKSKWNTEAVRNGSIVAVYMTGGGECLWLNMYLDMEKWCMTCDSDIGFYAYHWYDQYGTEDFISFCCRWLSDESWLLRKCIGGRHVEKQFDAKQSASRFVEMLDDCEIVYKADELEEILDDIAGYDTPEAWLAMLESKCDIAHIELPDEWYVCVVLEYSPWQKRFAEISREAIVPALQRLMKEGETNNA